MPRVSVIVPNFNYRNCLDRRIKSILAQTYTNYEIIILDDCSTDGSAEIIELYRDNPKVSNVVYNEGNSGSAFKQWKKGIDLANGELIWIAESDDFCDPCFLETLVSAFDKDPDCVISFCRSETVIDGTPTGMVHKMQKRMRKDFTMAGRSFCDKWQKHGNYIVNASGALIKKLCAQSVDSRYTDYTGAGDLLFWFDAALQGNVHFFCKPMNKYSLHSGSQTAELSGRKLFFEESLRIREIFYKSGFLNNLEYYKYKGYICYYIKNSRILSTAEKNFLLKAAGYNASIFLYVAAKTVTRTLHRLLTFNKSKA